MTLGVKSTVLDDSALLDDVIGNRAGSSVRASIAALSAQLASVGPLAEVLAENSADFAGAVAAEARAEAAEASAIVARIAAEAARDVAIAGSILVWPTTAAGVAAVPEGGLFWVPDGANNLQLYKDISGVATIQTGIKIPLSSLFAALLAKLPDFTLSGYSLVMLDALGRIAAGLKSDGTFRANEISADTINGTAAAQFALAMAFGGYNTGINVAQYAMIMKDAIGRIAFGVKSDGTVVVGPAEFSDKSIGRFGRNPGTFTHQVNFIVNAGQSNAAGSGAADVTTVQEYDNVGFASFATAPTAFLPLTLANTRNSGGSYTENPLYGGARAPERNDLRGKRAGLWTE